MLCRVFGEIRWHPMPVVEVIFRLGRTTLASLWHGTLTSVLKNACSRGVEIRHANKISVHQVDQGNVEPWRIRQSKVGPGISCVVTTHVSSLYFSRIHTPVTNAFAELPWFQLVEVFDKCFIVSGQVVSPGERSVGGSPYPVSIVPTLSVLRMNMLTRGADEDCRHPVVSWHVAVAVLARHRDVELLRKRITSTFGYVRETDRSSIKKCFVVVGGIKVMEWNIVLGSH
mmetsp:Transcript_12268/g.20774  ORF Transcript_12268/g.20774 Transcript_12268/m.20774 type:complete len:228 (+) Transcript_12268:436-1119(+)